MKNSKRLMGILFILVIFLLSCMDTSPDLEPEAATYPTPELIMNGTPVPTGLTSLTSTATPTIIPEQTTDPPPEAESTGAPTEYPEATSDPAATSEQTPEPIPTEFPGGTPYPSPVIETTATPAESPEGTPYPAPVIEATATPAESPQETSSPTDIPGDSRIIITEIMYNPDSPDIEWEWIELYNRSDSFIDLSGWVVDDGNKTPHKSPNITSGIIPSHGTGILFNNDLISAVEFESAWRDGINVIPVTDWGTMGLNNSGDKIGIWNSFDAYNGDHELFTNTICAIHYSEELSWPAADGSASLYLTDLDADYRDGNQWALSSIGMTTPLGICYQSISENTNSGGDIGSP
ncbi:MAG: lamin tail domain-containing protein [Spirochaetales bacterium]|nr:lamin tail domain-containing protein [Spirochaetales bacterium]